MTSALVVYRVELVKLRAQSRLRLAVAVAAIGPVAAALVFRVVDGLPKDTLFGRHLRESGYALPLVLLGFAAMWALPLLSCLVAGDIFSAEDARGTWPSLLTRSVTRRQVYVGKLLAAALSAVVLVAVATLGSLVGGLLLAGSRPLVGLGGQVVPPATAALLVVASWASVVPPVLGFAAVGCLLSTVTRSSIAGIGGPVVLGLLMTLLSLLDGLGPWRELLLTEPMFAWRGFWQPHAYLGPLWQGALVSLGYIAICLPVAGRVLLGRDVT